MVVERRRKRFSAHCAQLLYCWDFKIQLVKDSVVPIAVVQVVVDVESGLFGAPIHGGESRSSEEEKVD